MSPHEKNQMDRASADEYNKLEMSIKGLPPEEQLSRREEHRAKFETANPNSFLGNITGKANVKLDGYNKAVAQNQVFHTSSTIDNLYANFTDKDEPEARLQMLTDVYTKHNAEVSEMSPNVARLWREASMTSFNEAYALITSDAQKKVKEEAVNEIGSATDGLMQRVAGVDLVKANTSLEGLKQLEVALYVEDEKGVKHLDPTIGEEMFNTAQAYRKGIINQGVSKGEASSATMEKMKYIAGLHNSPELFHDMMTRTNGSGMTGQELNPNFYQDTMVALGVAKNAKVKKLTTMQEAVATKESKAIFTDQVLRWEVMRADAELGNEEAQTDLGNAVSTAYDIINNNPNMKQSDKIALISRARIVAKEHRAFVASDVSDAHSEGLLNDTTDMGSIENMDMYIYHKYPEASPEVIKIATDKWKEYQKAQEGLTKIEKDNYNFAVTTARNTPLETAEIEMRELTDQFRQQIQSDTKTLSIFNSVVPPRMARLQQDYKLAWTNHLVTSKANTKEQIEEAIITFQPKADQLLKQAQQEINRFNTMATNAKTTGSPTGKREGETSESTEGLTVIQKAEQFLREPNNASMSAIGASDSAKAHIKTAELKVVREHLAQQKDESPEKYFYDTLTTSPTGMQLFDSEYSGYIKGKANEAGAINSMTNPYSIANVMLDDIEQNKPELLENPDEAIKWLSKHVAQVVSDNYTDLDPRMKTLFDEMFPQGIAGFTRDNTSEVMQHERSSFVEGDIAQNARWSDNEQLTVGQDLIEFKERLERLRANTK